MGIFLLYNLCMSKQLLLEGINEICDAVKSTYGNNGSHVLFDEPVRFTLDGVSVAKDLPDPEDKIKRIGYNLIRSITSKTEQEVGDGTTTTAVFAQVLANSALSVEGNKSEIRQGLHDALHETIKKIKKEEGHLLNVAKTSCKDDELAKNIVEILEKDPDMHIDIKKGGDVSYKINSGITLGSGYNNPSFAQNGVFRAENCLVYVLDDSLTSITELDKILLQAKGRQVVFIGEKICGQALETLIRNNVKLKTCAIDVENADKLAEIIGTGFLEAKSIEVFKDKTILSLDKDISDVIDNSNHTDIEKKALKGQVCEFNIGGETEEEQLDRFYRVEDAIGSTRNAIKSGSVKGGGQAFLVKLDPKGSSDYILGYKILEKALQEPHRILGGGDTYDSYLVSVVALTNAVILADLLLNTGKIYAN